MYSIGVIRGLNEKGVRECTDKYLSEKAVRKPESKITEKVETEVTVKS